MPITVNINRHVYTIREEHASGTNRGITIIVRHDNSGNGYGQGRRSTGRPPIADNNTAAYLLDRDSNPHIHHANSYLNRRRNGFVDFYTRFGTAVAQSLENRNDSDAFSNRLTWPNNISFNYDNDTFYATLEA